MPSALRRLRVVAATLHAARLVAITMVRAVSGRRGGLWGI